MKPLTCTVRIVDEGTGAGRQIRAVAEVTLKDGRFICTGSHAVAAGEERIVLAQALHAALRRMNTEICKAIVRNLPDRLPSTAEESDPNGPK